MLIPLLVFCLPYEYYVSYCCMLWAPKKSASSSCNYFFVVLQVRVRSRSLLEPEILPFDCSGTLERAYTTVITRTFSTKTRFLFFCFSCWTSTTFRRSSYELIARPFSTPLSRVVFTHGVVRVKTTWKLLKRLCVLSSVRSRAVCSTHSTYIFYCSRFDWRRLITIRFF